jgi:succinate dehydrogenase / fumarate reductase iron-sulfur subunit
MSKKQTFLIYRKNLGESPRYERYEVPLSPGMSILEALFYIQDHYDSSLAFRYACRGAICGSCGMTINKIPQLSCKTQVILVKFKKKPARLPELVFGDISTNWDRETEILIEPLPHMDVIKDIGTEKPRF